MTKEVLALFPFVCATLNELIVSLSAEKDLAVSPRYDQNSSHFPQKVFSSKKRKRPDGNKGLRSELANGISKCSVAVWK